MNTPITIYSRTYISGNVAQSVHIQLILIVLSEDYCHAIWSFNVVSLATSREQYGHKRYDPWSTPDGHGGAPIFFDEECKKRQPMCV